MSMSFGNSFGAGNKYAMMDTTASRKTTPMMYAGGPNRYNSLITAFQPAPSVPKNMQIPIARPSGFGSSTFIGAPQNATMHPA